MRKPKNYTIYDVVTKETIEIEIGSIVKTCEHLNIDSTSLPKLTDKTHIGYRYILPEAKDKIFTLVDFETGIEYDCIRNGTIFLYFGLTYSENESKYIYALKKGRQCKASVCGRLFYLKGGREAKTIKKTKVFPDSLKEKLNNCKIKRVIRLRIQARLYAALAGKCKSSSTKELLGCDTNFLKKYIESKFTNFMGWHNRDLWHIDHIRPCYYFDLNNPEEQKKCFHYTNLQPIWKSTKIATEMGELDYQGNYNKHSGGLQYDYILVDRLCKNNSQMTKLEAKELAVKLFESGFRLLG